MRDRYYDPDPGDVPDVRILRTASPVARVGHECGRCHGPIAPGDRYLLTILVEDGQFAVDRAHPDWQTCHSHVPHHPDLSPELAEDEHYS